MSHIYQFLVAEVIHKVLAGHAQKECKPSLLLLTSHARHLVAPLAQILNLALVGQSHQHYIHVEEHLVFRSHLQFVKCLHPVAVGKSGYAVSILRAYAALLYQRLFYVLVVYLLNVYSLHSAAYCLQQLVGLLAHHYEHRLTWRLLNQLQQFVCALYVHALGQPYYAYLISALTRFQTQFPYQVVALAGGYYGLLVFAAHSCHPLFHREVESVHHQLVPLFGKVVAHWLVLGAHRWQFYGRVGKVQVGVLQLGKHSLSRWRSVVQQIAAEGHSQG